MLFSYHRKSVLSTTGILLILKTFHFYIRGGFSMAVSATGTGNVYEFNGNHYEVVLLSSWVSQSDAAFAASQLSYNGVRGTPSYHH